MDTTNNLTQNVSESNNQPENQTNQAENQNPTSPVAASQEQTPAGSTLPPDNSPEVQNLPAIELSTQNEEPKSEPVPTNNPQNIENLQPNEQQKIVDGVIVDNPHRPTLYSQKMLALAKDYYIECLEGTEVINKNGEKRRVRKMPLLEELARICEVDGETLQNWGKVHEVFFDTIKRIKELQKERIIMHGFTAKNPTFDIFMLKANHGMIETERKLLAMGGDRNNNEPMRLQMIGDTNASGNTS